MSSFSKNSKTEIINQQLDPAIGVIPFVFGLLTATSNPNEKNSTEITTDIKCIHNFLIKNIRNVSKNYKLIQEKLKKDVKTIVFFEKLMLNDNIEEYILLESSFKINEKIFYKIIFKSPIISELFSLYGLREDFSLEQNLDLFSENNESLKSFIKGVYIGSATSSIKISKRPNEKTSSGYHLEFSSKNIDLLREVSHIIAQFDIYAKLIERKNNFVLYIKDAEHVSDLLALVGANNSVLALKSEVVKREFRNKINRQTNCLSGNISKTVEASIKQLQAIEKIDKTIGLNSLPPDLEEVALMRLANPEEPLSVLLKLSNLNLTKSGLNHRLRRLISISENL